MNAYKNDPDLKSKIVKEAAEHAAMDRLLAGSYYKNGSADWKGCSVGCFTRDPNGGHAKYPELMGLPEWLARLQDRIFEGLAAEHRVWWHTNLFTSIPVGADLEPCLPKIMYWTLTEGIPRPEEPDEWGCWKAVDEMAALVLRWANGDRPTDESFEDIAARAAEAAGTARVAGSARAIWAAEAAEAAWATWATWAARATGSATWAALATGSATWAARATGSATWAAWAAEAAEAAWATWATRAARETFYKSLADKTLEVLREAKREGEPLK